MSVICNKDIDEAIWGLAEIFSKALILKPISRELFKSDPVSISIINPICKRGKNQSPFRPFFERSPKSIPTLRKQIKWVQIISGYYHFKGTQGYWAEGETEKFASFLSNQDRRGKGQECWQEWDVYRCHWGAPEQPQLQNHNPAETAQWHVVSQKGDRPSRWEDGHNPELHRGYPDPLPTIKGGKWTIAENAWGQTTNCSIKIGSICRVKGRTLWNEPTSRGVRAPASKGE